MKPQYARTDGSRVISRILLDDRSSSSGRGKNFLFSIASRLALGPTQPPIQWVPWGDFPRGWSGRDVKLTPHLQLVPKSRIRGSVPPVPHTSSWYSAQLVNHRDNCAFTLLVSCGAQVSKTSPGRFSAKFGRERCIDAELCKNTKK
jgi:hypothetical protein